MKFFLALTLVPSLINPEPIIFKYLANWQETRIKIGIIDTGLKINPTTKKYLCKGNHYDFTGTGIEDNHGHGTNITGIIAKTINLQTHCIVVFKYWNKYDGTVSKEVLSFEAALQEKVKFINLSSGGPPSTNPDEKNIIEKVLKKQIYVIVSSGNEGKKLTKKNCDYYPACYNFKSQYFKVIGNGKSENEKTQSSNYGEIVTDWRKGQNIEGFGITMSGSSQSTAIFTSELIGKK